MGDQELEVHWFLPRPGVGDTVSDVGILDVERVDQPTKYIYIYNIYRYMIYDYNICASRVTF